MMEKNNEKKHISIHALREEGDGRLNVCFRDALNFNPRPPRGGRPVQMVRYSSSRISIHALREEGDAVILVKRHFRDNFNPRPPRGGRQRNSSRAFAPTLFQSTPSARRATLLLLGGSGAAHISIHALREEGDSPLAPRTAAFPYFNPRPPRGGRHKDANAHNALFEFQSTPSARRATRSRPAAVPANIISIHALREEGDGRQDRGGPGQVISIHALREEGDRGQVLRQQRGEISIHALREEGDAGL